MQNQGRALEKLAIFVGTGFLVGFTSWDVHRHMQANSVPVTQQQERDITEYKRELRGRMEQSKEDRSLRFLEGMAGGGGGGDGGGGGGGGGGDGSGVTRG